MPKSEKAVNRRKFLKGAAVSGMATLVAGAGTVGAQPLIAAAARPQDDEEGPEVEVLATGRPGSDFMVDVIKSLGFEYLASNPGSSFRGLHESIINYGGNKAPEFLTCCHEESSVALAQGYAEVEGKPMLVFAHSTVGLQHASMGIYNAWGGRVPVYIILGNTLDATKRGGAVQWYHSAQDAASLVRDFTKWDDTPISLQHFAESAVRAYKISMTLPMSPTVLVVDSELQENPIPKEANLHIPKLTLAAPPQGDSGSVAEAARLLVAAENPVIIAGRVGRTEAGAANLKELGEILQVAIGAGGNGPAAGVQNADVVLGLDVTDFGGVVSRSRKATHISISTADLYIKSNYQDFQRYAEVEIAMAADSEATLPSLIEAVKRLTTDDRKRAFQDRGIKLVDARKRALDRARTAATNGWNASPISLPRLSAEVWAQVKNEDWAGGMGTAGSTGSNSGYPWVYDKHYRGYFGGSSSGIGYASPDAVGAALAHRKYGRLYVHAQTDGDLMYANGVLWTAAHHRIPMLAVMHNNRAYHQEVMHIQRMANRHQRGIDRAHIGTTITDPNIDYAKLAQSMGWYAEGPIDNPNDLAPAIKRAIAVVKRSQPALLDVVTQPR